MGLSARGPANGLDQGQMDRYDARMVRARQARVLLLQDGSDGFDEHLEVLDLVLANPYTPCDRLASRMGRSRTWFEARLNEICELVGV